MGMPSIQLSCLPPAGIALGWASTRDYPILGEDMFSLRETANGGGMEMTEGTPTRLQSLRGPQNRSGDSYWSGPLIKRQVVPRRHNKLGIIFERTSKPQGYQYKSGRVQTILAEIMERGYGSELGAISFAAGISSDHMASYLDGSVPRSREVVEKMERSLGIETNRMVSAWDWDALEAIDSIYPIPEGMLPEIANLIEAVRLATSHLNGLGPVRQALKKGGFPSWNIYTRWNDLYKARVTPFSYRHFYRHVPDILIASGIMSAAEAIVTLEEAASAKVDMEISTEDLESAAERALADGRIVAEAWMDPEGVTTLRIISEVIHHSFKFLTMREEEVVRMSMGLGYSREYSFEEIGDIFDVSRERIRYIVMKALRKLRHLVFSKRLKDLWRG